MSMALLVQVACLLLPICLDFLYVLAAGCGIMGLQLVLLLFWMSCLWWVCLAAARGGGACCGVAFGDWFGLLRRLAPLVGFSFLWFYFFC